MSSEPPRDTPRLGATQPPRTPIVVVALVVAVSTTVMIVDGRMDEHRLVPAAVLLLACLAALLLRVPLGPWRIPLVAVGALASGAFALFLVGFCGRILEPERPQIASPGAGLAWALTALGTGIAVVPLAAMLLAKAARSRGR